MTLRIASIDSVQFGVCVNQEVWGSNMSILLKWQIGDKLLFFVEKHVAGLAEVVGQPYISEDIIWNNGLFPKRVPIKFIYVLPEEKRIPTNGMIKDLLMKAWGYNWGWGIPVKYPVPPQQAEAILNFISETAGLSI